jgi:PAS domain S-box-containing protein
MYERAKQSTDDSATLQQRIADLELALVKREQELSDLRTTHTMLSRQSFAEALLETVPALVLVLDMHGRIVHFNRSMEELTGFQLDDVIGRDWFQTFLPQRERCRIHTLFEHIQHDMPVRGMINPIVVRDGSEREIEWYARTLSHTDGTVPAILSVGVDITKRSLYERQREAIISAAAALRSATTRDDMIRILFDQVLALLHTKHIALVIRSLDRGKIVVAKGLGCFETSLNTWVSSVPNILDHVIKNGQTYYTHTARSDPLLKHVLLPKEIETCVCLSLIAQTHTIGAMCIACTTPLSDDDIRLLNAISDMAANALHRASLHEQTQRRLNRIQALYSIDQSITTTLDVYHTLNVALSKVVEHLNADAATILLYNPILDVIEYAVGTGFRTTAIQNTRVQLGEGFAGTTAERQSSIVMMDLNQVSDWKRPFLGKEEQFVTYYGISLVARGELKGVLELFQRTPFTPDQEWLNFLNILARQIVIAIDHAEIFAELQRSNDELLLSYDTTIQGLARALELRDAETEGHSRRVTKLTIRLAQAMGFSEEEIVHIRRGAILHDIGKVAIPDAILLKDGPLNAFEYAIMQLHTTYAYDMLSPIPFLQPALDIPYCHHEKWDGTGYPRNLKGEEIPLSARMFAIVDVFDALSSDRPYRKKWNKEEVQNYLRDHAGTHFDPHIVETFLRIVEQSSII